MKILGHNYSYLCTNQTYECKRSARFLICLLDFSSNSPIHILKVSITVQYSLSMENNVQLVNMEWPKPSNVFVNSKKHNWVNLMKNLASRGLIRIFKIPKYSISSIVCFNLAVVKNSVYRPARAPSYTVWRKQRKYSNFFGWKIKGFQPRFSLFLFAAMKSILAIQSWPWKTSSREYVARTAHQSIVIFKI